MSTPSSHPLPGLTSGSPSIVESKSPTLSACLYVVATPIGNMDDMTPRAVNTLRAVDIIACEDTRTSGKLLAHFNIEGKTWAYHEHNSEIQTPKIIEMIQRGHPVALISDAGTPLVSDPGFQLVQAAHAARVKVVPVAGVSAVIAALSAAGLPSDRFSFIGFLPAKTHGRQKQLTDLKERSETLIFYEAPHRILASLEDMRTVFGGTRPVTYCRELTKPFETVRKTTLDELINFVSADPNQQKGEIVLVIGGQLKADNNEIEQHDKLLLRLLDDLSVKKAAALASDITGVKKNALYQRLLTLTDETSGTD